MSEPISQHDLKKFFPGATKSVIARNSLGGILPQVAQQKAERALDGQSQGRKAGGPGVARNGPVLRITLINFRRRELDSDNYIGGTKPLRDAIARWLGLDDSDRFIHWQYGQQQTSGIEGTAVTIEKL